MGSLLSTPLAYMLTGNLLASEISLSHSSQDGLPSTPQTAEDKLGRYNSLRSILREKNRTLREPARVSDSSLAMLTKLLLPTVPHRVWNLMILHSSHVCSWWQRTLPLVVPKQHVPQPARSSQALRMSQQFRYR